MIEGMFGPSKHTHLPLQSHPKIDTTQAIKECIHLETLLKHIRENRCVAVDFTSKTCGPCVAIAPVFEEFIREKNEPAKPLLGIKVETSMARDICAHFQISATPTFKFFLDGQELAECKGANRSEIKSNIDFLIYSAYPPHTHSKLKLQTLESLASGQPCHFQVSSNLELIFKKLDSIIALEKVEFPYAEELDTLRSWMMAKSDYTSSTIVPHDWHIVPFKLLESLPVQKLFPLLDILRLLSLNPTIQAHLSKQHHLVKLVDKMVKNTNTAGTPSKLMLLRLLCNQFSLDRQDCKTLDLFSTTTLTNQIVPKETITAFVIDTLLSEEAQLRQGAALCAFNLAWTFTAFPERGEGIHDDHWAFELLAAVSAAIEKQIGYMSLDSPVNDETGTPFFKRALIFSFSITFCCWTFDCIC